MPADLIIYVIIVLALVVWLRNTMGANHRDEHQGPNPLNRIQDDVTEPSLNADKDDDISEAAEQASSFDMASEKNVNIDNATAEQGLLQISGVDRNFDLGAFVTNAQDAFVLIVEAFAKGDREALEPLLQEDVYSAFDQAISEREKRKETQETEIQAVRKVDVVDARLVRDMAFVSLRLTAEEASVTKDGDGSIIAGDPDRLYTMTDRWTFGRNVKSRDPVWYLYETNDDEREDHDSVNIPDSKSADA